MPLMLGGCFAPPLGSDLVQSYRNRAQTAPPEIKEAMVKLCDMVDAYLPHARPAGESMQVGQSLVAAFLPHDVTAVIWDHVPWAHECDMLKVLFETIDNATQKPLRDAAFHLLWYAIELEIGRHPITSDRLATP